MSDEQQVQQQDVGDSLINESRLGHLFSRDEWRLVSDDGEERRCVCAHQGPELEDSRVNKGVLFEVCLGLGER